MWWRCALIVCFQNTYEWQQAQWEASSVCCYCCCCIGDSTTEWHPSFVIMENCVIPLIFHFILHNVTMLIDFHLFHRTICVFEEKNKPFGNSRAHSPNLTINKKYRWLFLISFFRWNIGDESLMASLVLWLGVLWGRRESINYRNFFLSIFYEMAHSWLAHILCTMKHNPICPSWVKLQWKFGTSGFQSIFFLNFQ